MENFKAVVSYDGTRYNGWQVQKNTKDTIQGKLEALLFKLTGEQVDVIGSGRTDAGVHARGQVCNFHCSLPEGMTVMQLKEEMNRYLPEDISVLSLERCDERFHARFSAVRKTYRYRVGLGFVRNVFERKYVYAYAKLPDIEKMRGAAQYLIGTHDFMAFCGNRKMKKSTIRTIDSIVIEMYQDDFGLPEIRMDFTGDGFLQNMIRILSGTLLQVGIGEIKPEEMKDILESKDRERAGFTAPPEGLCLMRVEYDED